MHTPSVLMVDRDPDESEQFHDALTAAGFTSIPWLDVALALQVIRDLQPVAIVLDHNIESPDDALSILGDVRTDPLTTAIPVILLSDLLATVVDLTRIVRSRADIVLIRPFGADQVISAVRIAAQVQSSGDAEPSDLGFDEPPSPG